MIKIELSGIDTILAVLALMNIMSGNGGMALFLIMVIVWWPNKIAPGEKPYFTFTTETTEE